MADQFAHASDEARQARAAVNSATAHGQRGLNEALGAAERTIIAATNAAERLLKDSLGVFRSYTAPYTEEAVRHLADGRRYVLDHVRQRPLTVTLAGLSVGLFLGMLWSSRSKQAAPN